MIGNKQLNLIQNWNRNFACVHYICSWCPPLSYKQYPNDIPFHSIFEIADVTAFSMSTFTLFPAVGKVGVKTLPLAYLLLIYIFSTSEHQLDIIYCYFF